MAGGGNGHSFRHMPTPHAFDEDAAWRAVLARDARADGAFVYAVRSTGIYCRPTCPSRRPARGRVELFPSPAACDRAEAAGYRECKRCRPRRNDGAPARAEQMIREARALIDAAGDRRVTLTELAGALGTSPTRLQRAFTTTLGISPREYQETRRMERLRERLRAGSTVSAATYDAGFAGPRRVYERATEALGMTPATYRRGGAGVQVSYDTADSSLGKLLVATTERGICAITLAGDEDALLASLRAELPNATLVRDEIAVAPVLAVALRLVEGEEERDDLTLDVGGTAFQQKVWRELRRIPAGETRTYTDLAAAIGQPTAVRAVARACATNRVAVAIPCHRVVRGDGTLGGYRWGIERKAALLEREKERAGEPAGAGTRTR